jgi:hypothetical protein
VDAATSGDIFALCLALVAVAVVTVIFALVDPAGTPAPSRFLPVVRLTGRPPTGYVVMLRDFLTRVAFKHPAG